MTEFRTWRELLAKLIGNPVTKQFIVTNSKLHPTTLQRWADGVHNPYGKSLKLLLQSIPPEWQESFALLVNQEFPSSSSPGEQEEPSLTIPAEFYLRVLRGFANEAISLRLTSALQLIEQQLIGHLDPLRQGLVILLARCLPPPASRMVVRSLRGEIRAIANIACSQAPRMLLIGAESFSGSVLERNQAICVPDTREQPPHLSCSYPSTVLSVAAAPLRQFGAVAGCLTLCSPHPFALGQRELLLIEQYAELLALAFPFQEFYEPSRIALATFPSLEQQQPFFATFQQRLTRVRQASPTSLAQAELQVWQQIEAELIAHSSLIEQERSTEL
jgi:hypothetical protein